MKNTVCTKVKRVLFFDSGVGGLSVYRDVKEANPTMEGYYLFDNECFPYGTKTESFLEQRVTALLKKATWQFEICAVVIACNTASTLVLPEVRAALDVPVVGVVPAIKPAARLSKKKIIGLMATPGTVHRQYTRNLIRNFAADCKIVGIPSPILASIAENRLVTGEIDEKSIEKVVKPILDMSESEKPDVIVLGCTHYPFVVDVLKKFLPEVTFIDSGKAIGRRVRQVLSELKEEKYLTVPTGAKAFFTGVLAHPEDRKRMVQEFGFESLQNFEL